MSEEDQLYQLARRGIDRRNRRMLFMGADILAFFIFVAAFSAFDFIPHEWGVFISVVWIGALALHMIALGVVQSRDGEIEREVERLRRMLYEDKPKRLALGEDGELVDDEFEANLAPVNKPCRDSV